MQFWLFQVEAGNISKPHNLIERLDKSSECREELYHRFHNVWYWKKAALVLCYLNNIYDIYASLQTFSNFLMIKKINHIKTFENEGQMKFPKLLDSIWIG